MPAAQPRQRFTRGPAWCCAERRCSRRPRPPAGAACCRPRDDAWPAVTGPPAVAAGAARRRAPSAGASAGGTTRQGVRHHRLRGSALPVSNTASRNSGRYCAWCKSDRAGPMSCVAGAPLRPAPRLCDEVTGPQSARLGSPLGSPVLSIETPRLGHGPDSAGSGGWPGSRPLQEEIRSYLLVLAPYLGIGRK